MPEESFVFHGQTTFINRPRDTVIRDFQNEYVKGDGSTADQINSQLGRLVELLLESRELPDAEKEEAVRAVDTLAAEVTAERASRFSLKGTLREIGEVVQGANDIAKPALGVISTVLKIAALV